MRRVPLAREALRFRFDPALKQPFEISFKPGRIGLCHRATQAFNTQTGQHRRRRREPDLFEAKLPRNTIL